MVYSRRHSADVDEASPRKFCTTYGSEGLGKVAIFGFFLSLEYF